MCTSQNSAVVKPKAIAWSHSPASASVDVVYAEQMVARTEQTRHSRGSTQTRWEAEPVLGIVQSRQASLQALSGGVATAGVLELLNPHD